MSEVALFLAHAIALEAEAAERYDELANMLEVHNNQAVADIFRKQAHFSRLHWVEVRETAKGLDLPQLKPWEYRWQTPESPEAPAVDGTHYLMTAHHCVQMALQNERRGHQYYADTAHRTKDPEVTRLAGLFASEEAQHVTMLEKLAATIAPPPPNWDLDLDPPAAID